MLLLAYVIELKEKKKKTDIRRYNCLP